MAKKKTRAKRRPANRVLAEGFISQKIDTLRYGEGAVERVAGHLEVMQEDLDRRTRRLRPDSPKSAVMRIRRQEALLKVVNAVVTDTYKDMRQDFRKELVALGEAEAIGTLNTLNAVLGSEVAAATFTRQNFVQIATSQPILGSPSADWWAKQKRDTALRFEQQVRLGVQAGESMPDIVNRVIGEPTGQRRAVNVGGKRRIVRTRSGGVISASKREATTLVRTAVQNVSNQVMVSTYEQNSDVINALEAVVTLDARTSDICMARSGAVWNMSTGAGIAGTTESFPGPPPWHHQCRTVLIPVTKRLSEITNGRLKDKIVKGTRASMDGTVVGDLKFEDWLAQKGEAFARDKLGPGKYDLWKSGRISLRDLIDQKGRPLTVAELKAKHGNKPRKTRKITNREPSAMQNAAGESIDRPG